jgi:hypothetical protein
MGIGQRDLVKSPCIGRIELLSQHFDLCLTVNMQSWEVDSGLNGADDFIGGFSKSFSIDTLWDAAQPDLAGNTLDSWYFADNDKDGDPDEGKFRAYFLIEKDNFVVNANDTSRFLQDLWWRSDNYTVPELSKQMYADTFADVDENDSSFWHQLQAGFYEDSYKKLAASGICFGIDLEAVYALKGRSIFRQPISQHRDTHPVFVDRPDEARDRMFQLRHGYQFSSEDIEYTSDKGSNRWNPILAYNESRDMFNRGDFPIFSIGDSNNVRGHALVPFQWIDNGGPTLTILAANANLSLSSDPDPIPLAATITIDRASNTFSFMFGSFADGTPDIWRGGAGENNGGRFFAQPYRIYANTPYTPTACIGIDLTVLGAADGSGHRPVFAPLGLIARGNKAFFQIGGAATVQQVYDRAEGAYFQELTNIRGFEPMPQFTGLYRRDGGGVPFRPNAFVLTTSAERPLFFPNDLPDAIAGANKWDLSHLAALIQSRTVMPNLLIADIEPLYSPDVIQLVKDESENMIQRGQHETLDFILENADDQGNYHWYMASRHAHVRLETNAVKSIMDRVTVEQTGEVGQLVTFHAGGLNMDGNGAEPTAVGKKLKAHLLNPAHNRMWVLDEMKADMMEPLSFQLNNGGNQVWIYNANNDTNVDVQFWENDNKQPDVHLRGTNLAPNSITGFESVAPNSIRKEVYRLPGGDPISTANYSNLHLDCRGLIHEWMVLSQAVTGNSQVSTNAPAVRPDNGGWFYCHDRVVDFCLEDGDYFIIVQSAVLSMVRFTIKEGVVSYPAELEGIVEGSGSNTLVLRGLPLTVDGRAIQDKLVIIPGAYGLDPDPLEHMHRPLVTGQFLPTSTDGTDGWFYWFNIDSGEVATFSFQLCLDGAVRYDPQFEGMVRGHGTNVLTILEFVAR